MRYRTVCDFECRPGYSLIGNSKLMCLRNGQWTNSFPVCKVFYCPQPPAFIENIYHCTDDFKDGSKCHRICREGYDIEPGKPRVILCQGKRWRGEFPDCIDVTSPRIEKCTPFALGVAYPNSTVGQIKWSKPKVTDNSNDIIQLKQNIKLSPGDNISVGSHEINFTAEDNAGNQAKPCIMTLQMKVLYCPRLYNTNYMTVTCPSGNQNGAQCSFSCRNGSELIGQNVTTCEMSKNRQYADWDFKGGNPPYCEVYRRCVDDPVPPKNGVVACDTWLGGKFCHVLCPYGYYFKPDYAFYDMLVCGNDGTWRPKSSLPIPDCSKTYEVKNADFQLSSIYYFDGNCMELSVKKSIVRDFTSSLSKSKFNETCTQYNSTCQLGGVKIICGASTKKRSAEMKIVADILIDSEESKTGGDFEDIQSDILYFLQNETTDGPLDLVLDDNVTLTATDMSVDKVAFKCPNNTFPSYQTSSCVECPAGTHYDKTLQTCLQCSKGHYQPLEGQPHCIRCPDETTTAQIGSKFIEECLDACPRGHWSMTGVTPCSPCLQGSYTGNLGTTVCTACPPSQTTLTQGSTYASECTYFDIVLNSPTSKATVELDIVRGNSSRIILSAWLRFTEPLNFTSPNVQLSVNDTEIQTILIEETNSSNNIDATDSSISIDDKEWTFVLHSLDLQEIERLQISENDTFTISMQGPLIVSQLNIWSSNYDTDQIRNESDRCANNVSADILPWKTWETARFEGSWIQIPSLCDDINECDDNPCGNNSCTNELGGFSCTCNPGYRGEHCEENIDECLTNICQNNSTCVDGINEYTCLCPPNYKGDFCEMLFLHGHWSSWERWSQCSETCGNGTKLRKRYCNNPAPYNGGEPCVGNDTEISECNVKECPVCSVLDAPENGTLNCTGSPDTGFNCTISCKSGFSFDRGIKPFYECGPTTLFLWDFKTDDNPNGNLPTCNPVKESKELSVNYRAQYGDLFCNEENKDLVQTVIEKNVGAFLEELPCRQKMSCNTSDFLILNCGDMSAQSIDNSVTSVGFKIKFTCSPSKLGSEVCAEDLTDAVNSFENPTLRSILAANLNGTVYEIDANQTSAKGEIQCDTGYVSSGVDCVPCGVGNFYTTGSCRRCDFGFYQDELGQTSCKQCPPGMTTAGRASRDLESCSVKMILEENYSELYTGIGVSMATLVVVVTFMIFIIFKVRKLEFRLGGGGIKVQPIYKIDTGFFHR
ncbi:uncharacterized protein LOC111124244 isoform X3 [Crassostrea virginica]